MVDRWIYSTGTSPQRQDIIVFKYPEDETKDFMKRVIGMPGDVIEIRDKQVVLNGAPLDDRSYTQRVDPNVIDRGVNPRDNFGPVTVPQEVYFVLGDNRDQSLDSRFWGYVKLSKIKGKVSLIYWSWDTMNSRVRWERIGQTVQ
jgi:signal peptidase I